MAESYYQSPRNIQIGNVGASIKVRRLSHAVKRDLRNYFSNYALERETGMFEGIEIPAGHIEDVVMRRGLEELHVGGSLIQFNSPSPVDDFPDVGMGDEDGDIDLYEEVLKTIVDKNRFLARIYPFSMVFAQYLTLVNRDKSEYEKKQNEETGAKQDKLSTEEELGKTPTPSEPAMPTVERISGTDISGTAG